MKYLITGGTGSLGEALVKRLLSFSPIDTEVRVYSRDEYKQSEMSRKLDNDRATYWLGDVRDLERLKEACEGVDIIIHTAAMKRMDTISRNASEVVDINITGTKNVMIAGKNCKQIIFVSTDKAYKPECIYGASKMVAEGIVLARENGIVWRFGNFINSRGSVWEIFKEQKKAGVSLTLTDPEATRFIINIDEVCDHILLSNKHGGLNYPENLKSMTVLEIANSIAPRAKHEIVGLREGEKLHEAFNEDYSSDKIYERNNSNGGI